MTDDLISDMRTHDDLGQIVRAAWVAYCRETGITKPSHIASWEALSEWEKEVDRRIGQAVIRELADRALHEPEGMLGPWPEGTGRLVADWLEAQVGPVPDGESI